jgi:hypothetical protein
MPIVVLSWAMGLAELLLKIPTLLKEEPPARKRKIAQQLTSLHNHIADTVSNGKTILSFLSNIPAFGSIKGANVSAQLYDRPFNQLDFVCASAQPEKLEQLTSLLSKQERSLNAIVKILTSRNLKNLGIVFDDLPSLQVAVVEKFGTVTVLLSTVSQKHKLAAGLPSNQASFAEEHLRSKGFSLKSGDRDRPRDWAPWISNFRPEACQDYESYLLVYSQKEVDAGNARLDALQKANTQLRKFLRQTFEVHQLL